MNDIVIKAENLGKMYTIGHQTDNGSYVALRDVLMQNAQTLWNKTKDLAKGKPLIQGDTLEEVWALKDVSFEIRRGEAVGIIGLNGAGKSTLLKILSRITEPSEGRVTIKGRVASLLEVGTGFHPELTGRENIYLNGTILGMSRKEIKHKFDEIVFFAEVEKYLDTPVKRYSSGMYVRLAFAVAAHLEPEILVVDEVLSVGDASFQKKCLGKMNDVANKGRTVLFVSHNMAAISQLTAHCMILSKGKFEFYGSTDRAINLYVQQMKSTDDDGVDVEHRRRHRYDFPFDVKIVRLQFPENVSFFRNGEPVEFVATVRGNQTVRGFRISLTVFRNDGFPVGSTFSADSLSVEQGEVAAFRVRLDGHRLAVGRYHIGLSVGSGDHRTGHKDFDVLFDVLQFEIGASEGDQGTVSLWAPNWGAIQLAPPEVVKVKEWI